MIKLALIGGTLGLMGISGMSVSNFIESVVVLGLGLFTLSVLLQVLASAVRVGARWRARRSTDCRQEADVLSQLGIYSDSMS